MPPDFIGIGAQKCGTTWLYRCLDAHPSVWVPKEKELHFFDEKLEGRPTLWSRLFRDGVQQERWRRQATRQLRSYRRSRPSLSELTWDLHYFFGETDERWYGRIFEPAGDRVSGEFTPDYSVLERERVRRVYELIPDARIVFLIRNPIERAWSQVSMRARMGVIGEAKPADMFPHGTLLEQADNRRSQRLGDYISTMDIWMSFFPPERFFLGFLEDIHFAPRRFIKRVCDFLEVPHPERYPFAERVVHASALETMPIPVASGLAQLNAELIDVLAERLGGHASWWCYTAQRLIEDPPDAPEIRYPLWKSPLWQGWMDASDDGSAGDMIPPLQSGPYPLASRDEGRATSSWS